VDPADMFTLRRVLSKRLQLLNGSVVGETDYVGAWGGAFFVLIWFAVFWYQYVRSKKPDVDHKNPKPHD
jgi:hypothetical protein